MPTPSSNTYWRRCWRWRNPGPALERGETLGIVGMGAVGRRLAAVARRLGWRLRCCDPYLGPRIDDMALEPFAALLGCRVLSLHPSLLVGGPWPSYHLLDEPALARLRAPQTLINAARGPVVDNRALWRRLQAPDAPAVVLDVWEDEPRFHARLLTCEALRIATPHIAGYSVYARLNATQTLYRAMFRSERLKSERLRLERAAPPRGDLSPEVRVPAHSAGGPDAGAVDARRVRYRPRRRAVSKATASGARRARCGLRPPAPVLSPARGTRPPPARTRLRADAGGRAAVLGLTACAG